MILYLYNSTINNVVFFFREQIRKLQEEDCMMLYRRLKSVQFLTIPWKTLIKPWNIVLSKQ